MREQSSREAVTRGCCGSRCGRCGGGGRGDGGGGGPRSEIL